MRTSPTDKCYVPLMLKLPFRPSTNVLYAQALGTATIALVTSVLLASIFYILFVRREKLPSSLKFTHDLGALILSEPTKLTHAFSFTNTTDAPLTVEAIKKTCGCLDVTLNPSTIYPNETATVVLLATANPASTSVARFRADVKFSQTLTASFEILASVYAQLRFEKSEFELEEVSPGVYGPGIVNVITCAESGDSLPGEIVAESSDKSLTINCSTYEVEKISSNVYRRTYALRVSRNHSQLQSDPPKPATIHLSGNSNFASSPLSRAVVTFKRRELVACTPSDFYIGQLNRDKLPFKYPIKLIFRSQDHQELSLESINCPSSEIRHQVKKINNSTLQVSVFLDYESLQAARTNYTFILAKLILTDKNNFQQISHYEKQIAFVWNSDF